MNDKKGLKNEGDKGKIAFLNKCFKENNFIREI